MIRFENSTGAGNRTRITNAETGEDISKVLPIEYGATIRIEEMVVADCRIAMTCFDVTPGKTVFHALNPVSGRYEPVSAIEFRGGCRVEIAEDGTPTVRQNSTSEERAT